MPENNNPACPQLRDVATAATVVVAIHEALLFAAFREDDDAAEFWAESLMQGLQRLSLAVIELQKAGWR